MLVAVVLLMILPQRKQKKKAEEMMAKLQVGSYITTIGGILGQVTEIDSATNTLTIQIGSEEYPNYMRIVRNAIYTVNSTPNGDQSTDKPAEKKSDDVDEIK